jgi:hypothetical protein
VNTGFCAIIVIIYKPKNPSPVPSKKHFLSKNDFVPRVTFFYSILRQIASTFSFRKISHEKNFAHYVVLVERVLMPDYRELKRYCQRALTPITIMLIPHDNPRRSLNLNIPAIGLFVSLISSFVGAVYLAFMIHDAIQYKGMEKQLLDYSRKVYDFNATLLSLKKGENELHQLLALGSTGSATANHVHYEVWHKGKSENPNNYTKVRS